MSVMVVASRPCPKLAPYIRSLRLDESRSNAESNSGAYRFFNHASASVNPLEQPVKLIPTRNSQKNRGETAPTKKSGVPTIHNTHRTPRSHGSIGPNLAFQNFAMRASAAHTAQGKTRRVTTASRTVFLSGDNRPTYTRHKI